MKFFIPFLLFLILFSSCKQQKENLPEDYELTSAWADMTNYITKNTPANSPTFASRCFGYIGLTMYESVVNGYPEYQSVAPQLNGLGNLILPERELIYNWQLALNAGQAEVLRNIYIQTSDKNKAKIDSLEHHFEMIFKDAIDNDTVINRSIAYGKKLRNQFLNGQKLMAGTAVI